MSGVRVFVGRRVGIVRVLVGRSVLVAEGTGVVVAVPLGNVVRAVSVMNVRGVCVFVGVRVGVRVGVEVGEGMSDAVGVGAVDVGKGPKSACEVRANAVFVLFASFCPADRSGATRNISG